MNKNRSDPIYDSVLNEVKTLEQRVKGCKRYVNLLMLEARARFYKEPVPGALEISPLEGRFKKVVAQYKGTYVIGWMGSFRAEGPQSLLDSLYQSGIRAKTAQDFGIIDIS